MLAALPVPAADEPVRLWVDRAFTIRGSGTVVTGTLGAGTLRVGDELSLDGTPVAVRGLQSLERPVSDDRRHRQGRGEPARAAGLGGRPGRGTGHARGVDVRVGARRRRSAAADLPAELTLHAGSAAVPARVRPARRRPRPG